MAEDKNEDGEGEAEVKSGGGMKRIIMMVVAMLLVAVISFLAAMMMFKGKGGEAEEVKDLTPEDQMVTTPEQGEAIYLAINPNFVASYESNNRQRYVQVELSVMGRDQAAIDSVTLHMPLIRQRIIETLRAQDFEELRTDAGRQFLSDELARNVQEILTSEIGRPGIEKVLFRNFVIQ